MEYTTFAVLGGDKRFAQLTSLLANEGYTVYAAGFDTQPELITGGALTSAMTAVKLSDVVILPMPATKDGETLNAPLSSFKIALDKPFFEELSKKKVFAGLADKLLQIGEEKHTEVRLFDYCKREDFQLRNAEATAEGALCEIIANTPRTICKSRCLITGFGRIGKSLAPMLRCIGADVTVAARKAVDFALIDGLGMNTIDYSELPERIHEFDTIINTVPFEVLDRYLVHKINPSTVIIDLASLPGGVDLSAAQKNNITVISALALPGKYSSLSAAEIIKSTIFEILKEEK
jgi:dipicolinate synthase subunit A